MKFLGLSFFLLITTFGFSQENKISDPQKGAINVEFTAGLNNTTPVGIGAKALRDKTEQLAAARDDYSGNVYPKTAAYVGILIDYQFHRVGALGAGLFYTPKGFWFFEDNTFEGFNWNQIEVEKRKTFVTVDYFDIPIFYKEYLLDGLMSIRFGPVISMALLSKVRIEKDINGEHESKKYRLGEGEETIHYEELPNTIPRFVVPGFEAALNIGNTGGLQGSLVVGFSGSLYENADYKSVIARLGLSYTFSK